MASTNYSVVQIKNGIFPSNTYIFTDIDTGKSLIIDPGLDREALVHAEKELGLKPVAVLATHGHFDHIGHAAYFQEKYKIPFYLHEKDLKLSQSANFYLKVARLGFNIDTPVPDHLFRGDKYQFSLAGFECTIYNFPGHTPGSCVIQHKENLFTGDIFYKNGLGFNHFPGENPQQLKESIRTIFHAFTEQTNIYPGHGSAATLGTIKSENKELINFIYSNEEL